LGVRPRRRPIFEGSNTVNIDSKFSTWLIQITINEARMKSRKNRHHLYESIDEGQQNEEGDYIPRDFADWREIPSEALESVNFVRHSAKPSNLFPKNTAQY
jgi:DNA-directed RNA polymerase specialized sigma24 family protein